jgi:hypothetical protein
MPGGCTQTYNPFAIVEVVPYVKKPIDFTLLSICKPYNVQFNCTTPNVVNYEWNFGDGEFSSDANPLHTYDSAGTYNVILTLTIGSGCITVMNVLTILFNLILPTIRILFPVYGTLGMELRQTTCQQHTHTVPWEPIMPL